MNHIFRVIWNTSIQSWSVVSELSRAHKKQSVSNPQSSAVNLSGVFKLSAIALSFFTASSVYAAVSDDDFTDLQNRVAALENQHTSLNNAVTAINNKLNATSVVIGESAVAAGSRTTVVGAGAKAVEDNSVAIGNSAVASFINATAMGAEAKAAGAGSVAIGKDATADKSNETGGAESAIAIGNGAKAQNNRAIAIGKSTVATGQSSIAFGENAKAEGMQNVAIGFNSEATRAFGVAIGVDAKSNATNGLALGYDSKVTGLAGTAIANHAKSLGEYSVAIGDGAESKGDQSLALGSSAKSEGNYSFAAGVRADAKADAATAIGLRAEVMDEKSISSVVIGTDSQITNSRSSVAIGQTAKNTSSQYSVALGESALNTASNLGVAIGSEAKNDTSVRGTAIGFQANTKGQDTIAFGTQATSSADRAVSIGINSVAKARDSYAIGTQASSLSREAVVIGNRAAINEKAANSIAIGSGAYVGVQNATSEVGNTPAKVSQPLERITKDNNEISVITQAESHKYDWSMAIGHDSRAYGYQTLALGNNAAAYDTNSTAVGMGSSAQGHFSNALGYLAKTEGKYATAIGYSSVAAAESATAVGTRAVSNLKGAVALGSDSRTSVDKNVFGYDVVEKANKTLENVLSTEDNEKYTKLLNEIMALETERTTLENNLIAYITDAANDPEGKTDEQKAAIETEKARLGTLVTAKQDEIKTKQTEANNMVKVWRSTGAAVSVGDVGTGLTRQITNVAAGTEDTDAVNVAQLKSLAVAGIQFSANDYDEGNSSDEMKAKIIKKQIGGILPIQGKSGTVYGSSNSPAANYSSDNLITFNDNGTLRIGMLKAPTFSSINLGDTTPKALTVDNGGKLNFDGNEVVTKNNFGTIFSELYEFKNGLKTSIEGNKTVVSLDKDSLKNDPSFKGDKGDQGEKGADGKSAYDAWKAKDGNQGKTEEEFLTSLKGTNGVDGKSAYDLWKAKDGNQGKTEEEFLTSLKGTNGVDGKSAYDLWKAKDGNQGKTEEEFLTSIKGAKGDQGEKGADGKSAYDAWKEIPANEGKTKDEFLASLKGAKGDKGDDGKSAYEVWKAQAGNENKSPQEFADSLKGTNGKDGKSVKATVTDNSDGTHTLEVTNSDNTKTSTKIKDGKNGKSAYEIWRDNGNTGKTEQQFVDSLNANTKLKERVDTIENTVHNHSREIQQNRNAIAQVNRDMQKMNKELRAGIAGAIAIGSLYQNTIPGKETISAGLGSFKGQNAVAVGYSRLSDNGRVGMKANISINSSGDAGAGASIGYTW